MAVIGTLCARLRRFVAWAVGAMLVLLSMSAVGDGGIEPGSGRDRWTLGTSRDGRGRPLIFSLRAAALELRDRARYRWRVGISWRFRHALDNGMPGPEDRGPMTAIDDAVHEGFEQNDENRIVYFMTGGGIREIVVYGTSEAAAWKRVAFLIKQFPDQFPGDRRRWAYVKEDAGWETYRTIVAMFGPAK